MWWVRVGGGASVGELFGSGAGGFGNEVISSAIDMEVGSFVVVGVFSKEAGTIVVNG